MKNIYCDFKKYFDKITTRNRDDYNFGTFRVSEKNLVFLRVVKTYILKINFTGKMVTIFS